MFVPAGFAHGFLVLSQFAEVLYKASDFYAPEYERCIIWNDPDIGIHWPIDRKPRLSYKDSLGVPLSKAELFSRMYKEVC